MKPWEPLDFSFPNMWGLAPESPQYQELPLIEEVFSVTGLAAYGVLGNLELPALAVLGNSAGRRRAGV